MDIQSNPRPNHRLNRCCGNCKFFLVKIAPAKKGACILPDGPKTKGDPNRVLRPRYDEFDPTFINCVCDNHIWKRKGYLKSGADHAGVSLDDIR